MKVTIPKYECVKCMTKFSGGLGLLMTPVSKIKTLGCQHPDCCPVCFSIYFIWMNYNA